MEGCGNRVSCRGLFKKFQILPLKSQYTGVPRGMCQISGGRSLR